MFFFQKKKKKKLTVLKVLAVIVGILALAVGAYVLYTKVIKPKLEQRKAAAALEADSCCGFECDDLAADLE